MRITLNFLFSCCLLSLAISIQAQQQNFDDYVGGSYNKGAAAIQYYICTGGLSAEQLPFSNMLKNYNYPLQEMRTSNNLTEFCIGPILNGTEAELIRDDIKANGFVNAYLNNNPTSNFQQGSLQNVANKQDNFNGWPAYPPESSSGSGVNKAGMKVYNPQNQNTVKHQTDRGVNNSNSENSYGNTAIQFTPPPEHDFTEDRLNDALTKVALELHSQLPDAQEVLNQQIEPGIPQPANTEETVRPGASLNPMDKGALLPVFLVQLAALNTTAEAAKYKNLTSDYTVYLLHADNLYKLMVGPFYSKSDADNHRQMLINIGYKGAFIKDGTYFQREPHNIEVLNGKTKLGAEVLYPKK